MLRKKFGLKRDEVTGEWGRLHKGKIYDLHSLPNITRVIKLRRMKWAGHVAYIGERRGTCIVLVGKLE